MAVHDRCAAGKCLREPLPPPQRRAGVVDHPDPLTFDLDHASRREDGPQVRLVHVPCDALDRRELPERLVHGEGHEVAGVKNEVGLAEEPQALSRKPPRPPRHVGIGDDRDVQSQDTPRKRPSR